MNLSSDQLDTLRHMLGINSPEHREPRPYRDYAAVNPGDLQFVELERLGAVMCYRRADQTRADGLGNYDWYRCTPAGRQAAIHSHRNIRHSRSERRYIRWLELRDVIPDLTFHEFLTASRFRETRAEA